MAWNSRPYPLRLLVLFTLSFHLLGVSALFSVHDDLLAFPQFQLQFPDAYATEEEANERLAYMSALSSMSSSMNASPSPAPSDATTGEQEQEGISPNLIAQQPEGRSDQSYGGIEKPQFGGPRWDSGNLGGGMGRIGAVGEEGGVGKMDAEARRRNGFRNGIEVTWEAMWLAEKRYLCSVPVVKPPPKLNATEKKKSKEDEEKELIRATTKGLELLKGMEGNCIFFISGWWSYSFCHNDKIRQFHQVPPTNGVPMIPPVEDPNTPAYILGRASVPDVQEPRSKEIGAEMQTNGELKYLVQKLGGGTKCDITGKDRRIEVQFHCHPNAQQDKIGYIKEVTTCCYLMVIYTKRLCEDTAFLPPKQDRAHGIECREILNAKQIEEYQGHRRRVAKEEEQLIRLLTASGLNTAGEDGSPDPKQKTLKFSLKDLMGARRDERGAKAADTDRKKEVQDKGKGESKGKGKGEGDEPTIMIVRLEERP